MCSELPSCSLQAEIPPDLGFSVCSNSSPPPLPWLLSPSLILSSSSGKHRSHVPRDQTEDLSHCSLNKKFILRGFPERQHMALLTGFKCEQCWGFRSAGRIHLGGDGSSLHHPSAELLGAAPSVSHLHKLREFFLNSSPDPVPRPPSNARWGMTEHGSPSECEGLTVQKGSFSHCFIWRLSISSQL